MSIAPHSTLACRDMEVGVGGNTHVWGAIHMCYRIEQNCIVPKRLIKMYNLHSFALSYLTLSFYRRLYNTHLLPHRAKRR